MKKAAIAGATAELPMETISDGGESRRLLSMTDVPRVGRLLHAVCVWCVSNCFVSMKNTTSVMTA